MPSSLCRVSFACERPCKKQHAAIFPPKRFSLVGWISPNQILSFWKGVARTISVIFSTVQPTILLGSERAIRWRRTKKRAVQCCSLAKFCERVVLNPAEFIPCTLVLLCLLVVVVFHTHTHTCTLLLFPCTSCVWSKVTACSGCCHLIFPPCLLSIVSCYHQSLFPCLPVSPLLCSLTTHISTSSCVLSISESCQHQPGCVGSCGLWQNKPLPGAQVHCYLLAFFFFLCHFPFPSFISLNCCHTQCFCSQLGLLTAILSLCHFALPFSGIAVLC